MRLSRLLATTLALSLAAGACADDTATPTTGGPDVVVDRNDIILTAGLTPFSDCDALLDHLRTEGLERVGPYGLNQGGYYYLEGDVAFPQAARDGAAVLDADGVDDTATSDAEAGNFADESGGEGVDFSGTNNQELGVDEPDIVKTDGDRILVINNGRFTYVDANDGDPVRRGSLEVGWDVGTMLVNGDRVILLGTTYGYFGGGPVPQPAIDFDDVDLLPSSGETAPAAASVEPAAPAAVAEEDVAVEDNPEGDIAKPEDAEEIFAEEPLPPEAAPPIDDTELRVVDEFYPEQSFEGPQTRIISLDISNPDAPRITEELTVDGNQLSARMVNGKVRVAIQSNLQNFPFVYPSSPSAEDRAEEFNRDVIRDSEIGDWLPGYVHTVNGEVRSESSALASCDDVHSPAEFAGFGSLSVLTIDMEEDLGQVHAASVLAAGETVYASQDTMWLSTNQWFDWNVLDGDARIAEEQKFKTELHGFDIAGDEASYLASGTVRGHLLNQFAMSEHDGVLRVATTDGPQWWGSTEESESFITTFRPDDKVLMPLGEVGEMGKGERIFAVRFVGETAYVVTFRQTDPFYTVDLSDPANPQVKGELKINGYSGQLHPIGEGKILGIGQDATDTGQTTGAKLTVFDVTDISNPTAMDSWTLPDAWTDAEWNHLAFLWWAPENLAVIPIQVWRENFTGAAAFHIDPRNGCDQRGRPDQP